MYKEELVMVSVNSRVMIDVNFFWKMNLNYFRPCADLAETQIWNAFGGPPSPLPKSVQSEDVELIKLREDDLIICCLTVLGFSFDKKLWNEFYLTYSDIDISLTSNAVKFVVINIRLNGHCYHLIACQFWEAKRCHYGSCEGSPWSERQI
jgi:hypothetical protein